MADDEPSLDTVFEKTLEATVATNRTDAMVMALHACLVADGFLLVAIGDEGFDKGAHSKSSISLSDLPSPGLPQGWNTSCDVYSFQYKQSLNSDRVCLVKALPIGDQLIINVLCSDKPTDVVTLTLSLGQYTSQGYIEGERVSMAAYRNVLKLFTTFNKEINSKIKQERVSSSTNAEAKKKQGGNTASGATSKQTPSEPSIDPLRIGDVRRPHPQIDPFSYGAADLSPFGGPGGMIMDPLRQGGMRGGPSMGPRPPGFHPPGARYDPVSPFGPNLPPNRRGQGGFGGMGGAMYGPDPDHLPPPGSDDWFS